MEGLERSRKVSAGHCGAGALNAEGEPICQPCEWIGSGAIQSSVVVSSLSLDNDLVTAMGGGHY